MFQLTEQSLHLHSILDIGGDCRNCAFRLSPLFFTSRELDAMNKKSIEEICYTAW
jgi:hypothetical protein